MGRPAGAVGFGGVVAAVGGDGVGEATPDRDDVECELARGRAGELARRARSTTPASRRPRRAPPGADRSSAAPARSVVASRKPIPASMASSTPSPSQEPTPHTASTTPPTSGMPVSHAPRVWSSHGSTLPGSRQVQRRLQVASFPGRRPRRLVRLARGYEPHQLGEVGRGEQQHRIDVAVADAQADVQHRAVVIVADAAGGADDLAAGDRLPGADRDRRRGTSTTCAAPPSWRRSTWSVPATEPAKLTTPSLAARTGVPAGAAMSTPGDRARTPSAVASKGRTTGPSTGRSQPPRWSAAAPAGARARPSTAMVTDDDGGQDERTRADAARTWRAHGQPRGR